MDRIEAARLSREALALLTARISDLQEQSSGLSSQVLVEDLGSEPADDHDAWVRATGQLLGMLNLATRLVVEISASTGKSRDFWLQRLSSWVTELEAD